jgi:HAD superfamily 5'-nucleotidase-like hydrolase
VPRAAGERKKVDPIHGTLSAPIDRAIASEAFERARAVLEDRELGRILNDAQSSPVPVPRQVFVNRNLHLDRVSIVGFDMDYTLAIYHLRRLEQLSYDMTVDKLIEKYAYPEQIRRIPYDDRFVLRGLFIDKTHGNLLKIDRYGMVGRAYHGRTLLDDETMKRLYRNERIRLKSTEYAWVDTLFALPEAGLFAGIVDLYEQELKQPLSYTQLYDHIRDAIDTVHRDNSLKAVIRQNIGRYIFKDPELAASLHKLRSGGKKLFVLTNSAWDYTNAVMSYLLDGVVAEYPSWRNYFDIVITSAGKPGFFTEHRPFTELDISTSEQGTPLKQAVALERGKVYAGGNLVDFERFSGCSGEAVLYVGDHIYGDILKSKKTSMWRTCMIVQEIEDEIAYLESRRDEIDRLSEVELLAARLDDEVSRRKARLNQIERKLEKEPGADTQALEAEFETTKGELDRVRRAFKECNAVIRVLEDDVERGFNPYWGLHFKEGNENSRFGEQVEQYACLYTSRVSNLGFYSPIHFFRSPRDLMPHEQAGALSGKMGAMGTEGLPRATNRAPTEIP